MPRPQRPALLVTVLAATALLVAACGSPSTTAVADTGSTGGGNGSVLSTTHTPLGTIVVNSKGSTVYLFAIDRPGRSACTGACLQYWPIVAAPATLPSSLPGITGAVGVLDRPDGAKQLTLNGWPLYTYAGDTAPGATAGEGLNLSGGLWWAVSPSGSAVKGAGAGASPSASSGGYSRSY